MTITATILTDSSNHNVALANCKIYSEYTHLLETHCLHLKPPRANIRWMHNSHVSSNFIEIKIKIILLTQNNLKSAIQFSLKLDKKNSLCLTISQKSRIRHFTWFFFI